MAKLRRTLLIGLGGTGFKAILNAKKMFYENYGEIPPMIGFLGIDTDRPGLENAFVTAKDGAKISLNKSEQLPICVENPQEIYQHNLQTDTFDWMPEANVFGLQQLSIGAGQMRSNGRFAITVNEKTVADFVNRKLCEVNDAHSLDNEKYSLLGAETEVHMVFSLGGGTGSGTFINTAYLIKRLLPSVKISGYAVLSDVFRSMVSGAMSSRVRPNGKGAIIDLDYLAHLSLNADPIEVKWFRQTDKFNERPFNALYLIDNRNDNNDMFADVNPICQMISLAIVTSVGELGVALDSISDNVTKLISDGAMDIKDKKAWVAGFGCTEIVFDGERLAKIYARKACIQLINTMLNGGCDDPANIASNWFDSTRIRENQGKDDVIDYFMAPNPPYVFQDIDDPDNPKPNCLQFINNRAVDKQTDLNSKLDDLETRVDEALTRLMNEQANRECGIFLCEQILHNILTQIELCDKEMKQEKEDYETDLPRMESALDTACKELSECMDTFFKRGRKDFEEAVCTQTMQLATLRRQILRRKMAREFYSWLRDRVCKSLDRVNIITGNLNAIRNQSNQRIQQLQREGDSISFFQFDLASDFAERVSCPMSDIVFNNFVQMMKAEGGISGIAAMTSQETEEAMLRFTLSMPQVETYRKMSVDDILDKMSEEEFKELMRRAINKSKPLLPYSYRGFEADLKETPVESYYIGVASRNRSRLAKDNLFQNLAGAKNVQFSEIGLGNRIIIYHQFGVIPAFTIRALDNYSTEYEKWELDKPYGSHWDKKLCERMKHERFDLLPKNETTEAKILEAWVQAIVQDIIRYDDRTKQYQIRSKGMGGQALRNFLVDMGPSRDKAYNYLADNFDVLGTEIEKALKDLDIPGPSNQMQLRLDIARRACADNTYLETVSKCPIPMAEIYTYPAIAQLIEKEMNFILNMN